MLKEDERTNKLGENIRQMRQAAGYDQRSLGKLIGVTGPAICAWESGKRIPTLNNLLQLAQVFSVTLDQITQ